MKRIAFANVAGFVVTLLSSLVMVGWLAHISELINISTGFASMSFNSAFCIFLAGIALLTPNSNPRVQKKLHMVLGFIIALIAALTLSQNVFGYDIGIDHIIVHPWLDDQNPFPGRMSGITSIGLILSGLSFVFLPYTDKRAFAALEQAFILGTLLIGLSALLGYVLGFDLLYSWYKNTRMAMHSALSITLIGLGLWSIWNNHPGYKALYSGKEYQKILLLTGIIFICLALGVAGMVVFAHDSKMSMLQFLEEGVPLVLFTIIIGMILLYWQAMPLIHKIVRSEKILKATNRRLEESESRFRSAFDYAATGMAMISPQGQCIKVNESLCNLLGYSESELLAMNIRRIVQHEDFTRQLPNYEKMLQGFLTTSHAEQRFYNKNGEMLWLMVSMSLVRDGYGSPLYFIAQFENVTAQKAAEEQLQRMAYHDFLTGLSNRNRLEQFVHQLINTSKRSDKHGFAVMMMDLDHFKNINDTMGHDAGDQLLRIIAERLKSVVRNTDLVARVGGDEFILVITDVSQFDTVAQVAKKILHSLVHPIVLQGHELYVTTSIGISVFPHDGQDMQTLIKNADLALYLAKEHGRNNYQFCTSEITAKAQHKMARQNALAHALTREEFHLLYLPKIDLSTMRITGVEALLRWQSKEFGAVMPDEIIALAEETSIIIPLSEWILKSACRQGKHWQNDGFHGLSISVNLSSKLLRQNNFVEDVVHVLDVTQFPAHLLELEVTEKLLMDHPETKLKVLNMLKRIGVKIAIDDFGTGYSSLGNLNQYTGDTIKIDKSFVANMVVNETSASIVTAIIAMAKKLGVRTLAEGVETKEQFQFLQREGCNEIQGYYLSKPLTADAVVKFLENPAAVSQVFADIKEKLES